MSIISAHKLRPVSIRRHNGADSIPAPQLPPQLSQAHIRVQQCGQGSTQCLLQSDTGARVKFDLQIRRQQYDGPSEEPDHQSGCFQKLAAQQELTGDPGGAQLPRGMYFRSIL